MSRQSTLRGLHVKLGQGWVVLRRHAGDTHWFPLETTIRSTRRDAIAAFERYIGPGSYQRMRRRGEVLAVWCIVDPVLAGHPAREP